MSEQWVYFLGGMPVALTPAQLADLDKSFGLAKSPNAEILRGWLLLVVANNYQPGFPRLEDYLTSIGRRALIAPLYLALMKTESGTEFAKRVFAKARPGYQAETVKAIEAIVDPQPEEAE